MSLLIAIDPGLKACGVACFDESNMLHDAYLVRTICESKDLEKAVANMLIALEGIGEGRLVIELPQVYRGFSKAKGDPNDLIKLAVLVGAIVGSKEWSSVRLVHPSVWKGQVDKKVTQARCREILSIEELAKVLDSKKHDVWDAIGLGLWSLDRKVSQAAAAKF